MSDMGSSKSPILNSATDDTHDDNSKDLSQRLLSFEHVKCLF